MNQKQLQVRVHIDLSSVNHLNADKQNLLSAFKQARQDIWEADVQKLEATVMRHWQDWLIANDVHGVFLNQDDVRMTAATQAVFERAQSMDGVQVGLGHNTNSIDAHGVACDELDLNFMVSQRPETMLVAEVETQVQDVLAQPWVDLPSQEAELIADDVLADGLVPSVLSESEQAFAMADIEALATDINDVAVAPTLQDASLIAEPEILAAPTVIEESITECLETPASVEPLQSSVESTDMPIKSFISAVFDVQKSYRVVLPNAKQGEAYESTVVIEPEVAHEICKLEFEPECGLMWNEASQQCVGVPNVTGDVVVKVWWQPVTQEQTTGNMEMLQTKLYINADPKSLWKNIPSDRATPFWKEDNASEGLSGEYDVLAARVRGRSHAHVGSCCDDDFSINQFLIDGQFSAYVVAVSDGAGSAPYSRLGSKTLVETAQKYLSQQLQDSNSIQHVNKQLQDASEAVTWEKFVQTLLHQAVYKAYEALLEVKNTTEIITDIKQLSSTLLLGFGIHLPNGQNLVGTYWVGDGAIAIYQPQESILQVMGEADSGEFSGQTRFLSKEELAPDNVVSRIQYKVVTGNYALIVMTDGVSDSKFDSEKALNQIMPWKKLWKEWQDVCHDAQHADEAAIALKTWLEFWSPGNHDDRSLVIVSPPFYANKTDSEQVQA